MGAWGCRNFENDDAQDFAGVLHEDGDISTFLDAINTIIEFDKDTDGPEAPEASMALAAIEYVAAAKGKPSPDLPEGADEWLQKNSILEIENIVPLSKKAIQQIRTSSELKDLWEEDGDAGDWLAVLDDLEKRIS